MTSFPLPENWEERFAPNGRKYYINFTSKTTTWTHPGGRPETPPPAFSEYNEILGTPKLQLFSERVYEHLINTANPDRGFGTDKWIAYCQLAKVPHITNPFQLERWFKGHQAEYVHSAKTAAPNSAVQGVSSIPVAGEVLKNILKTGYKAAGFLEPNPLLSKAGFLKIMEIEIQIDPEGMLNRFNNIISQVNLGFDMHGNPWTFTRKMFPASADPNLILLNQQIVQSFNTIQQAPSNPLSGLLGSKPSHQQGVPYPPQAGQHAMQHYPPPPQNGPGQYPMQQNPSQYPPHPSQPPVQQQYGTHAPNQAPGNYGSYNTNSAYTPTTPDAKVYSDSSAPPGYPNQQAQGYPPAAGYPPYSAQPYPASGTSAYPPGGGVPPMGNGIAPYPPSNSGYGYLGQQPPNSHPGPEKQ
jgi:hypothetical protein